MTKFHLAHVTCLPNLSSQLSHGQREALSPERIENGHARLSQSGTKTIGTSGLKVRAFDPTSRPTRPKTVPSIRVDLGQRLVIDTSPHESSQKPVV
jgi:hypothetical protein